MALNCRGDVAIVPESIDHEDMTSPRGAFATYTRSLSSSVRIYHSSPSSLRGHDVLASFRRRAPSPVPTSFPTSLAEMTPADRPSAYETASTTPAGTSLQDVPPPRSAPRSKLAVPLPAMKALPDNPARPASGQRMVIQGIAVPPKPRPPAEDECCMSGCVHCVYTTYADELETYNAALEVAREALQAAGIRSTDWPEVVRRMDDQGGVVEREEEKVREGMDPSMAAFLALENKLKKNQAPESSAAQRP